MKPLALILLALVAPAVAQTTRPSYPVAVWFQPATDGLFERWAARGVNTVIGPELGNPAKMTAKQWCERADACGLSVIANVDYRPANIAGFFIASDEPNAKGIAPATLKPAFDKFRTIDASTPVFASLAGDAVMNKRPWTDDQYREAAKFYDVALVNFYSRNRNADRYPLTHTATAIRRLIQLTGKPAWAMVECDWQRLPSAPQGRGPTPADVEGTAMSAILAGGATGLGYFPTVPGGQLGWPQSYDATEPAVSEWMTAFHPRLQAWASGLVPASPTTPSLTDVLKRLDAIQTSLDAPRVLMPATRPSN